MDAIDQAQLLLSLQHDRDASSSGTIGRTEAPAQHLSQRAAAMQPNAEQSLAGSADAEGEIDEEADAEGEVDPDYDVPMDDADADAEGESDPDAPGEIDPDAFVGGSGSNGGIYGPGSVPRESKATSELSTPPPVGQEFDNMPRPTPSKAAPARKTTSGPSRSRTRASSSVVPPTNSSSDSEATDTDPSKFNARAKAQNKRLSKLSRQSSPPGQSNPNAAPTTAQLQSQMEKPLHRTKLRRNPSFSTTSQSAPQSDRDDEEGQEEESQDAEGVAASRPRRSGSGRTSFGYRHETPRDGSKNGASRDSLELLAQEDGEDDTEYIPEGGSLQRSSSTRAREQPQRTASSSGLAGPGSPEKSAGKNGGSSASRLTRTASSKNASPARIVFQEDDTLYSHTGRPRRAARPATPSSPMARAVDTSRSATPKPSKQPKGKAKESAAPAPSAKKRGKQRAREESEEVVAKKPLTAEEKKQMEEEEQLDRWLQEYYESKCAVTLARGVAIANRGLFPQSLINYLLSWRGRWLSCAS